MGGDPHQVVETGQDQTPPDAWGIKWQAIFFLQGYVTKIGSSTLREVMIYKNLLLQNLF